MISKLYCLWYGVDHAFEERLAGLQEEVVGFGHFLDQEATVRVEDSGIRSSSNVVAKRQGILSYITDEITRTSTSSAFVSVVRGC